MSSIHIQCSLHAPAGPRAVQVSDDDACETAAARSACALLPSSPSKFNRKQSGLRSQGQNPKPQQSLSEQVFIQSIRRRTFEQLHSSELCPVGTVTANASEDVWAALEHIFLQ